MIVVGAGVIGIEYAIMLATLGVQVTVVDGRERLLDFCDTEIVDTLIYHARSLGIVFRLGEDVVGIQKLPQGMVFVQLESGKRLVSETVLFTVGRVGDTADLNLHAAGLEPDERGRLWCNENHQTWVPHIYGAGDVVGFPSLASVSMEQGRRAVCHAFGQPFEACQQLPYGLFTIPEISMVGQTEQKLTADCVPYEVGIARYKEIARGHIIGDTTGMLKILFHRHTRKVLGVHCIGEAATEIVHIGQAVMALGGTIDYFRDTVFNYPTMAECYKVAAFDGFNKMSYDNLVHNAIQDDPASRRNAGRNGTRFRDLTPPSRPLLRKLTRRALVGFFWESSCGSGPGRDSLQISGTRAEKSSGAKSICARSHESVDAKDPGCRDAELSLCDRPGGDKKRGSLSAGPERNLIGRAPSPSSSHRRSAVGSCIDRNLLDANKGRKFESITVRLAFFQNQFDNFFQVLLKLVQSGPLTVAPRQARDRAHVKLAFRIKFDIRRKCAAHQGIPSFRARRSDNDTLPRCPQLKTTILDVVPLSTN